MFFALGAVAAVLGSCFGEVRADAPIMKFGLVSDVHLGGEGKDADLENVLRHFDAQGVDAVMIGRGSIGQPWIFADIKQYLERGEVTPALTPEEQLALLKEHGLKSIEWVGDERKGIVHSRRHFAATPLFKGIPDFRQTRIAMLQANDLATLFPIMDSVPLHSSTL